MKHYPLDQLSKLHGFQIDAFLVALCGWQRGLQLTFHNRRPCDVFFAENTIPNEFPGVVFSLSDGKKTHSFYRTRGDKTSTDAIEICADKLSFKKHLLKHGINTPDGEVFSVRAVDEMVDYASKLGYPVVLKPVAGSMGRGVVSNIKNEVSLVQAIDNNTTNFPEYNAYIIEEYFDGDDYRLYVVDDEVIAAYTRMPAHVVGDGKHKIQALIEAKNKVRLNNPNTRNKLIKINENLEAYLNEQSLTLDDVPNKNQKIFLTNIPNISIGGEPTDVTNEISKDITEAVIEAVKSIDGLPNVGVDVLINPETKEFTIIEMNSVAVITSHVFPIGGEGIDIPNKIIDYYFPESRNGKKEDVTFDYLSVIYTLSIGTYESLNIKPYNRLSGSFNLRFKSTTPWTSLKSIQAMLQMYDYHGTLQKEENTYILNVAPGGQTTIEELIGYLQQRFLFEDYDIEVTSEQLNTTGIYIS